MTPASAKGCMEINTAIDIEMSEKEKDDLFKAFAATGPNRDLGSAIEFSDGEVWFHSCDMDESDKFERCVAEVLDRHNDNRVAEIRFDAEYEDASEEDHNVGIVSREGVEYVDTNAVLRDMMEKARERLAKKGDSPAM